MSIHPADIVVIAIAAAPVVAAGGPIEFNPVSAGILGAVIASMRKNTADLQVATQNWKAAVVTAAKWLTTLLSGASATVFGSPAICANAGIDPGHTAVLVYFGVGLIGSTIVDLIMSRDKAIAEKLLSRVTGESQEPKK